jgi:2',3'-cyclic-nucleotide 2'-phosphodiesterase (5'-nucleotidase family)
MAQSELRAHAVDPVRRRWVRIRLWFRATLALLLLLLPAVHAAASEPSTTISVISTNDLHGRLWQLPLLGGYLRNLRAARARDHGAVLLLDAGDIFQGTLESNLTEGAAMIRGYGALGYAAVALGNHEFDFGPAGPHSVPQRASEDGLGALKARLRQAPFPMLSANLRAADGGPAPLPQLRASTLRTVVGVRVGIIGGLTREALAATHSANTHALSLTSLPEAIAREAQALRAKGARIVIAVVHAGGDCSALDVPDDLTSCDDSAEAFELARALSAREVDLIVAGHTHSGVAQRVNGIPIIEAFANGRAFGRVDLQVPRAAGALPEVRIYPPHALCDDALDRPVCTSELYEGVAVRRDERVAAAISPDLRRAKAERERPLGIEVTAEVARSGIKESPLNNLVADLMLQSAPGADAAVHNGGAARSALPVGPLHYGTLFEVLPFDNTLATLRVTAGELGKILAADLASEHDRLSLAGLRAIARCQGGQIRVELSRLDGQRLSAEQPLIVVTSDFLALQAHGAIAGLALGPERLSIAYDRLIRAAVERGLRAYAGGRLDGNDKRLFDPDQPRIRYPGTLPLSCGTETPPVSGQAGSTAR